MGEAVLDAQATKLFSQMLKMEITPEQFQEGLAQLRNDVELAGKLTGATTAFIAGDTAAGSAASATAVENNLLTPIDTIFISADLVKLTVAYAQGNSALAEEALIDLATDLIPGLPAGSSRLVRVLTHAVKDSSKIKDVTPSIQGGAQKHLPSPDTKVYTEKEAMNLSGDNKGLIYVTESPRGSKAAQEFQAGTEGAFSDISAHKEVVPALRYNNTTNPNGKNYIKFDGIEVGKDGVTTLLIDAKTNLPVWNKGAMDGVEKTLNPIDMALKENPGFKVVYEFPDTKAYGKAAEFLREYPQFKDTITIRVRGE